MDGQESRSITLAPSIAIRNGEWVAMMNWLCT